MMEALDGNAIAGGLHRYFGTDMTAARGACRHCGATAAVAELAVYTRAPGAVARCRTCGQVVMVMVETGDAVHVHTDAFALEATDHD